MSVQARRVMGKDEATIRREAIAVAVKAIEEHVGDQREQETWLATVERFVDRAIVETRPAH
jgi:hypothetical protein